MSGLKLLVKIGKFFAIISRHTGKMNPGLRASNQFLALLVIGSAQHANLVAAFLVNKHDGEGQREEDIYSFNGVLAPFLNLRLLRYRKDWLLRRHTGMSPEAEHLPEPGPSHELKYRE